MSSSILVVGGRGFIGTHIARALEAAGYAVRRTGRPEADLARYHEAGDWRALLQGVAVVINAAGIIREDGANTYEAIHVRGPRALFAACEEAGASVIQVSALGADDDAQTRFHISKKAGDDALLALPIPSVVLQPSLVFGAGGASARMFATLASLPLIPLPGDGLQRIQPVHVDDLAAAVVAVVRSAAFTRTRIPVVGPEATTLRQFLAELRAAMGRGRARFLAVPDPLVSFAAGLGLLDRDALRMLRRGNVGDATPMRRLLKREPRAPRDFIEAPSRDGVRREADLGWLLPLLRYAVAAVWIAAAVVSFGLYPVEDSLALLARTGLTGSVAYVALYGAALLDLALGIGTLALRRRRKLWLAQIAVIVAYTSIITLALPEQWLHPYGPVVKNLPMLAAILLLYRMDERMDER